MKITQSIVVLLVLILVISCGSLKKPGDPGGFDGNYRIGKTAAIVFPIYESYEIEFQMFGDPILFYFDKKDEDGKYIYLSDDGNLKFVMEEGLKEGLFYEINEPVLKVVKEQ